MAGRRARRMMGPGWMVGVGVGGEAAGRGGWVCMFLVSEVNFSFSKAQKC